MSLNRSKLQTELADARRERDEAKASIVWLTDANNAFRTIEAERNALTAQVEERDRMIAALRLVLEDLDRTFEGRDADGAPSADGSYWLGHSMALRIWHWLHPEKVPNGPPSF